MKKFGPDLSLFMLMQNFKTPGYQMHMYSQRKTDN